MEYCLSDAPNDSTDGTWQSWIDWYAAKGYTYTGYLDASGDVTAYWMKLQKGSELYYAFLYKHPTIDRYWSPYMQWIKVDGVYYYTNELGIIYRNTWDGPEQTMNLLLHLTHMAILFLTIQELCVLAGTRTVMTNGIICE